MNKLTGEHNTLSDDCRSSNGLSDEAIATWKQLADCSSASNESSLASLAPRVSLDQSREILTSARQEARQLLDNARLQAEEEFQAARQRGFIDGQHAAICQYLELEAVKQKFIQSSEKELLAFIEHVSTAVLGEALKVQPESISERLKVALKQQRGVSLDVIVHPDDRDYVQKLISQNSSSDLLQLEEDPALSPGTFHLTTSLLRIESNPLSHLIKIIDHLRTSVGDNNQHDNLLAALHQVIFKKSASNCAQERSN